MKTLFMADRCPCRISLTLALAALLAATAGTACSQNGPTAKVAGCDPQDIEILLAIKGDTEIADYGATHFKSADAPFLAGEHGLGVRVCPVDAKGIKVVHLSTPGFNRTKPFINIDKIYFDDDAAFVELSFMPTGKSADVFLRKRNGVWRVTKRMMWES